VTNYRAIVDDTEVAATEPFWTGQHWRLIKFDSSRIDLISAFDIAGFALSGERHYRLRVPPYVPTRRCWAVSVHAADAPFVSQSPRASLDSDTTNLRRNFDGSIDLYFGATPPPRLESNWAYTTLGEQWLAMFRFFDPEPRLYARSWKLREIERYVMR
jgi:hypothetical protein